MVGIDSISQCEGPMKTSCLMAVYIRFALAKIHFPRTE